MVRRKDLVMEVKVFGDWVKEKGEKLRGSITSGNRELDLGALN